MIRGRSLLFFFLLLKLMVVVEGNSTLHLVLFSSHFFSLSFFVPKFWRHVPPSIYCPSSAFLVSSFSCFLSLFHFSSPHLFPSIFYPTPISPCISFSPLLFLLPILCWPSFPLSTAVFHACTFHQLFFPFSHLSIPFMLTVFHIFFSFSILSFFIPLFHCFLSQFLLLSSPIISYAFSFHFPSFSPLLFLCPSSVALLYHPPFHFIFFYDSTFPLFIILFPPPN